MSLLDRRLFMAVAWATLLTAGAWCSNAAAQLPLCNSKTTKAAKDCGTGRSCPNPPTPSECYVVMVEQQPNFTPCTGGTDSERCEAVNNFVCTKSWYCEAKLVIDPETGNVTFYCGKSTDYPKDGNGDQIISMDTSGTLVSCRRPGSS